MGKEKTQFKRGVSGNPSGRPRVTPEMKRLRELTSEEITQIGKVIVFGTNEDLDTVLYASTSHVLQKWIASVAKRGIQRGDVHSLNALLDRLVGKVTEKIEHKGLALTIIERLDGSEVVMSAEMIEEKE